jgi:hypothetical protein
MRCSNLTSRPRNYCHRHWHIVHDSRCIVSPAVASASSAAPADVMGEFVLSPWHMALRHSLAQHVRGGVRVCVRATCRVVVRSVLRCGRVAALLETSCGCVCACVRLCARCLAGCTMCCGGGARWVREWSVCAPMQRAEALVCRHWRRSWCARVCRAWHALRTVVTRRQCVSPCLAGGWWSCERSGALKLRARVGVCVGRTSS